MTDNECVCVCECNNDYLMRSNIISSIGVFVTTLAVYYQTKDWKIMIIVFITMIVMAIILAYWVEQIRKKED